MTDALLPPLPAKLPISIVVHGDTRVDEFQWLRDRDDPAVIEHLEAENAYTEASLARLETSRETLYQEIKARIVETDLSVPTRRGPWWYYTRTVEGLAYPIHCRRPCGASTEPTPLDPPADENESILYDENEAAEDHDFFEVGVLAISPDHTMLAIAVDVTGDERYSLSFRRIGSDEQPAETIGDVSYGFAWANDSKTAFYTRVDEAWRPHQLWRHRVGSDPASDVLVVEEADAAFNVGVGRSRDDSVIIITTASSTSTETAVIRADEPGAAIELVAGRVAGVEHGIEHHLSPGGEASWLMLTNADGAIDFRLDIAQDLPGTTPRFEPAIAHRPGVRLDDLDAFERVLILSERADAETRLRVLELGADGSLSADPLAKSWEIVADERPQCTWLGHNPDPATGTLRIGQTSMITPRRVAEVDLSTRQISLLKSEQVAGGYNRDDYVTSRQWAIAADGTQIPISLVHRRELTGPAPCLLYGYGAYEISIDPTFSSFRLSMLDRGVVFAIAHVRGGGELGRRWYDDGHLEQKRNSFSDFITVADHLIDKEITSSDRLAGQGRSAGGLLIGAVANRGPDRFCALVAEVPFVDALNTMLDPSLPLTVGEYDEWGNPSDDATAYRTIKEYAPYENVRSHEDDGTERHYPSMLFTGGLNDTRVGFWEPAKMAARLRDRVPGVDVLLRTEMGVGHGGPSGRYDAWRDETFTLAFILDRLGVLEVL